MFWLRVRALLGGPLAPLAWLSLSPSRLLAVHTYLLSVSAVLDAFLCFGVYFAFFASIVVCNDPLTPSSGMFLSLSAVPGGASVGL